MTSTRCTGATARISTNTGAMQRMANRMTTAITAQCMAHTMRPGGMTMSRVHPEPAGLALGAGVDMAIESAGLALVRPELRHMSDIVRLARASFRKMAANLWFATGCNALAIPLDASIFHSVRVVLSPAAGAALMPLTTVIASINAHPLRVKRLEEAA